jgi:hypothetical protein
VLSPDTTKGPRLGISKSLQCSGRLPQSIRQVEILFHLHDAGKVQIDRLETGLTRNEVAVPDLRDRASTFIRRV